VKSIFGGLLYSFVAVILISSSMAHAGESGRSISRESVIQMMTEDNAMTREQAVAVLAEIQSRQIQNGKSKKVQMVMAARGFDGSFFVDTKDWYLRKVSYVDSATGRTVSLNQPYLFDFTYNNGGLTISLAYKWVFMLVLGDMDIRQLDGAVFGRGIGVTLDAVVGVDAQYLPGKNRSPDLVVLSPQLGLGGGVRFPRITFHQNKLK
jgi:hypothetical protein